MEDYSAKLTAEPFLYNETKIIAEYILNGEDVNELKKRNIEENLIHYKKPKSIQRVNSPIFRRLSVLDEEMLREFIYSDIDTSRYILLYAIMKTDKLVRDFVFEVYQEKLRLRSDYIEKFDMDTWYESKKEISKNLKDKTENTEAKLKQVIFKILQDSGLVRKEQATLNDKKVNHYKIIKPILSDIFINMLKERNDYNYAKAIGGLV